MKTLHLSIMMLLCIVLSSFILLHNANAAVPLTMITILGGTKDHCENICFDPQNVTVSRGTAVVWNNKDLIPHTVVSGNPLDADNGTLFDSGTIWQGQSFIHNFNDVGTFHYFDKNHPTETGTITVTDETGITSTCCLIHGQNSTNILQSPLKQFKSGTPALDVKCNDGLQLIIKAEDASPACVKPDTAQILTERGWAWNYANVVGKESISLSAYQGVSNEAFYNNGTVASNFTINVNINNFKPSNASLVLQVYYNDGILYKTVIVPSGMIQPDGFYKYQLTAISDENHPVPFKVVATYNNETTIAYAPVFAHP